MVSPDQLAEAVRLLKAGEVVGIPTETVYGLAGDASNPQALARIFEVKNRPTFDPLIIHCLDIESVKKTVQAVPPEAEKLIKQFWPGPLTLVLPKAPWVPDLATSGLPSVAVRVPAHFVTRRLLEMFGGPLAAPSANRFGRLSPTTAAAVTEELGPAVKLVLDGGPCERGLESTIISFLGTKPACLRLGAIPLEEILPLTGPLEPVGKVDPKLAPGNLPSHYAPRTPLQVFDGDPPTVTDGRKVALLTLKPHVGGKFFIKRHLSMTASLHDAAVHFFKVLRELDASGADLILARRLPDIGLGRALNDRLAKATHPAALD